MREKNAQVVLLVRAFEECDPGGRVLVHNARAAATGRALMVTGLADWQGNLSEARNIRNGETVMRRARLIFDVLGRARPALHGILNVAQLGATTIPLVIVVAFFAGLLTNVLGPSHKINLLAFPLLGLLGWNLLIYMMMALRPVVERIVRRRPVLPGRQGLRFTEVSTHLAGLLLKGAMWRRLHLWRTTGRGAPAERRIIAKALLRFGALWHRLAARLLAARVRRMLHCGATAMVLGTVGGMYLRGIAFDYDVFWQSTLLDAQDVGMLLGILLGPASALLGIAIPDVAPLRGPDGSGDAAPWIHLYAVTAVLFVVLPRLLFVIVETWNSQRLSADVPVDLGDGYFRRLFTEWQGVHGVVDVWPYSYHPRPQTLYAAKTLLVDFFGAQTDLRVHDSVSYGEHAGSLLAGLDARDGDRASAGEPATDQRERYSVVLFSLAQSPESEVHGRFLEELKSGIDPQRGQILLLIDVAAYRDRIRDAERVRERLETWSRFAREAGMGIVELDSSLRVNDDILTIVGAALWPARHGIGLDE